jgi:endonuclease/exonuclease/phosphatase family metal-dependent hydrolase
VTLTVVTWNLKGSERPDTGVVVEHARAAGADVLVLQEVQRHQARAIARGLDAASLRWGFKHWPVVTWPEGMAVVGVSRRAAVRSHALTSRWRFWSWRRRILLTGELEAGGADCLVGATPSGQVGGSVRLVNLHLSPRGAPGLREREVTAVLDVVVATGGSEGGIDREGGVPLVVAGDLNDRPGAALFDQLEVAGLRDAWELVHPGLPEREGATSWSGDRQGDPRRRIDYVLVSAGIPVVSASVPRPGDDGFERLRVLADHLPVTATLDLSPPGRRLSG